MAGFSLNNAAALSLLLAALFSVAVWRELKSYPRGLNAKGEIAGGALLRLSGSEFVAFADKSAGGKACRLRSKVNQIEA